MNAANDLAEDVIVLSSQVGQFRNTPTFHTCFRRHGITLGS